MFSEYCTWSKFAMRIVFILGIFALLPSAVYGQAPGSEEDPQLCERIAVAKARSNIIADTVPWDIVEDFFPHDSSLRRLAPVCMFATKDAKEHEVIISLEHEPTPYRPRFYEWDYTTRTWRPLETTMNRTTNTVTYTVKGARAIVSVFVDTRDVYEGAASWYRHARYPSGAATNLYPIGTKLRVTNRENKKSTEVTITSTWTNTDKRRIIDLVSTAFRKIGPLSAGLIPIRIERVE